MLPFEQETSICNNINDIFENFSQQVIFMFDSLTNHAKITLMAFIVSCAPSPIMATTITPNTVEECNSILRSSSQDKYIRILERMLHLEDDWDYEGACAINPIAVDNSKELVNMLPVSVLNTNLKLFPTELGAVAFKLKTNIGLIRGEVGIDNVSYFVRKDKQNPEHHSFEPWDLEHIQILVSSFKSIV